MSAHRSLAGPAAALALAACLGASGCEDDDVSYQGSFANDLTAAEAPASGACVATPSACPEQVPSYAGEVAGIIQRHCGNCHVDDGLDGPWPFSTWQDVSDWSTSLRITLEQCLMPPPDTDAPLSDVDRQTLQSWLACGSPNN